MRLRILLALMAVLAAGGGARAEDGQGASVGAAVGYSTRFERAFLALDFLVWMGQDWVIVPNVSYVQTGSLNRWTAGVEAQWNAPAHRIYRKLQAWGGAGLSVVTEDPRGPQDATTRDLVANLVVGAGYDAPAAPFVQMRVTLRDPADVGLSVGVRF